MPDRRFDLEGPRYTLGRCRGCRVVATLERDDGVASSDPYPSAYWAAGSRHPAEPLALDRPVGLERLLQRLGLAEHVAAGRMSWVDQLPLQPGWTILDVGCGTGRRALSLMARFGCRGIGVEPDPGAAERARSAGLTVHQGFLEDLRLQEPVDAVLMIHSLEHIPDPLAALRLAKSCLRPDGYLVVALPNAESLERRLFRSYWDGWDVPRHLHHFGPESLVALTMRAGFEAAAVRFERYSLLSRSLANCLRASEPYESRKRRYRVKAIEKSWGLLQALIRQASAMQLVTRPARPREAEAR